MKEYVGEWGDECSSLLIKYYPERTFEPPQGLPPRFPSTRQAPSAVTYEAGLNVQYVGSRGFNPADMHIHSVRVLTTAELYFKVDAPNGTRAE